MLTPPVITDDFDGQLIAIDNSILAAAQNQEFSFSIDVPTFNDLYKIPNVVYMLIEHYTMRGFLCDYNGDDGKLLIDQSHPNMSWLEHKEITRATTSMIPNLGISFKACLLYLCMTNGNDIRENSDLTLQQKLADEIQQAATLGNNEVQFGFPSVPAPAIQSLFKATFDVLQTNGFIVLYNANSNLFLCRQGKSLPTKLATGENYGVIFDV